MKQEYRHTKPIRGKDPSFEKEWESDSFADYLQHCKINYLSTHNDGYTREYYRGELLRLKSILNESLLETEDTLNAKDNKQQ